MRFWDSSAIVPLLVADGRSEAVRQALQDDPALIVWWAPRVECASSLARLERDDPSRRPALLASSRRLGALAADWREVEPGDVVRETALRLLRGAPAPRR